MTTTFPRSGLAPTTAARPVERIWRIDIPGVTGRDLFPLKWHLYLSIVGLFLGVAQGLIQALERVDINLYDSLPLSHSYYQGLTLHGVALAFIFTFSFANGFLPLIAMKGFGGPMFSRALSNVSLYVAIAGVALAAWAIFGDEATVLFTFYSPMQAHPSFYFGAVLLVVSTWVTTLNLALTVKKWRGEHPGERLPLPSFMSITTGMMWFLASLGVAIQVLGFLLPWSLGWIDEVDPQFMRVLFWFTGHPIVYFWLLPAYICWYMLLPRLAGGGRLYSDGIARVTFIMFLVLLPVGVHHQFTDPGIPLSSKQIMWILTFILFMPSLLTAFSVVAALEDAGRKQGGSGIVGWIAKLKWGNPAVAGMLLAGIAFFLGGMSGLVNASYALNLVVHNTSYIVGHFHLTVGTAVALTLMAASYVLVPYLTGKALWNRRVALLQVWLWFLGVLTFSVGQMWGGQRGQPRRTQILSAIYYAENDWEWPNRLTAMGGSVMFLSGMLFTLVILVTLFRPRRYVSETQTLNLTEVRYGAKTTHRLLDTVWLWSLIAVVLSVLVYGEVVLHYWPLNPVSAPIKVW